MKTYIKDILIGVVIVVVIGAFYIPMYYMIKKQDKDIAEHQKAYQDKIDGMTTEEIKQDKYKNCIAYSKPKKIVECKNYLE
jgi:flagellar basal body-associated protein FliL